MDTTTAYQNGYQIGIVLGALIFLAMFIGLFVFFIIALIKVISTRRGGWIVGACLSGAPLVLFFILMCIGFVAGFKRGFNHARDMAAARQGEPSELLTADMSPVTGNSVSYQISIPALSSWERDDSQPAFDCLFGYQDTYVGVIAEQVGLKTPERVCDLSQKNISKKSADCTFSETRPITIDSHRWLTFDASATIKDIPIKYRFYDYADTNYTIQIVTWTVPKLFEHDAPVFDRIAQSFVLPGN